MKIDPNMSKRRQVFHISTEFKRICFRVKCKSNFKLKLNRNKIITIKNNIIFEKMFSNKYKSIIIVKIKPKRKIIAPVKRMIISRLAIIPIYFPIFEILKGYFNNTIIFIISFIAMI